ncbi:MAG: hypothetical protein ACR2HF_15035 [Methylococcaceae bacterium]
MMLDDLRVLMTNTQPQATRAGYIIAVIDSNVLGKPTRKARELALRHMVTLYGLDPLNPIFRALRRLWPLNEAAQPMLALAVALARDPLLRSTQSFVLAQSEGTPMPRNIMEHFLNTSYPGRFSAASLKSFAQNVAGTWTAAGLLQGRVRNFRSLPETHPESIAMLLFLSFLEGRTGQRLFSSEWLSLLCVTQDELESLANTASHRGLLVFMNAGGIKELRFPGYLTSEEEQIRQEASHVV